MYILTRRTVGRYFNVYLCIGVLFATYSFILDLIWYYNSDREFKFYGSWGWYLLFYLCFFPFSFPISTCYNTIINLLPKNNFKRICVGIIIWAVGAALFDIPSFYGGKRGTKTMIEMILVGFTVEIIRIIVVRNRERKKIELKENAL
jgi:hypothetical protein